MKDLNRSTWRHTCGSVAGIDFHGLCFLSPYYYHLFTPRSLVPACLFLTPSPPATKHHSSTHTFTLISSSHSLLLTFTTCHYPTPSLNTTHTLVSLSPSSSPFPFTHFALVRSFDDPHCIYPTLDTPCLKIPAA